MQTFQYKLNKDLLGRPAVLLNWALNELTFPINIILEDKRKISANSLIGLLSAGLKQNQIVTFTVHKEEQVEKVKNELNKLDFLQEVE